MRAVETELMRGIKKFCDPAVLKELFARVNDPDGAGNWEGAGIDADRSACVIEEALLEQLITFCQVNLDEKTFIKALLEISSVVKRSGDPVRAYGLAEMALERATETGDDGLLVDALVQRAKASAVQGKWKESNADLSKCRRILGKLEDSDRMARVENIIGTNYAELGNLRRAMTSFKRALSALKASTSPDVEAIVLMNLGIVHNIMGQIDIALTYFKRAQSQFEQLGDLRRLAELHHNIGMAYLAQQSFNDAFNEFDTSHGLSTKEHLDSIGGMATLGKASVCYHRQDFDMALRLVNQALLLLSAGRDRASLADCYKVKGMILREKSNTEGARSYLQTSLRMNVELKNRLNEAESYFELAVLDARCQQLNRAGEMFRKAKALFEKVGASREAAATGKELAKLRRTAHEAR